MVSPLGPLLAKMCPLEENLTRDGFMAHLYRRYVDDILAIMLSSDAATMFLTTLNGLHPRQFNLTFTMELPVNGRIPFIGIEIIKNGTQLETQVHRKSTNTGLLLHFHSHTDRRYKDSLLMTMLHRAYALSSTTEAFKEECVKLRSIFGRLDYPRSLIDFVISNPRGTLGISRWGCAARTLEPLAYTRASLSWILLPYTRVNSRNGFLSR